MQLFKSNLGGQGNPTMGRNNLTVLPMYETTSLRGMVKQGNFGNE